MCARKPSCCEDKWEKRCVKIAEDSCGLRCGASTTCINNNCKKPTPWASKLLSGWNHASAKTLLVAKMKAIAAGGFHTCALRTDGKVVCWGNNQFGALGLGVAKSGAFPPGFVKHGGTATALAAGASFTCALMANQTVLCWGLNDAGQVGSGKAGGVLPTPTQVVGLSGVVKIHARGHHTCAVLKDGGVKCWGGNGAFKLGSYSDDPYSATPVSVRSGPYEVNLTGAEDVVTLGESSCAPLKGGEIRCWGGNDYGELANGTGRRPISISRRRSVRLQEGGALLP